MTTAKWGILQPPRIFESPAMKAIVALATKIGPTDVPVLIAGETGAGKEVVAELIHASSTRKSRQMVCINCAGLPADLIESELFGSTKGSFTGSVDRTGIFKHASFGTVFLDELSEMPLALQSKLLRFIQDKKVRRVGAVGDEIVDVRIIAAVNRQPMECVKQNKLREDLYYRLSTITISVPPLRDRPPDIMPLAKAYLDFFSNQYQHPPPEIDPKVEGMFMKYDWPGNVRQLINEMNRCALLCNGKISLSDLSINQELLLEEGDILQQWIDGDIGQLTEIQKAEARAIITVMIATKFNKNEASRRLGIGRQTLYNKIRALGIKTLASDVRVAERTLLHTESAEPKAAPAPSPAPPPRAPRTVEQSFSPPPAKSPEPTEEGLLD